MRKIKILLALFIVAQSFIFAAEFETKGNLLVGGTPVEKTYNKSKDEYEKKYNKLYLLGDIILSNEYLTAGGKIYYRVGAADEIYNQTQRMEIKRAFVRFRPMGNKLIEISGGKLYSYYLPGNFFNIAEIYTGNSRWGESGVGVKSEIGGFTLGLGLPVGSSTKTVETATKYDDWFGLNGSLVYDFASADLIPLKLGAMAGLRRTKTAGEVDHDYLWAASASLNPKLKGFISKTSLTATFSYRAKPFVANAGFTPVVNYNNSDLAVCQFASMNLRSNFGTVQLMAEGEAGHSLHGHKIPLYLGTQLLIPIVEHVAFKPRFNAFAAVDSCDHKETRRTFEFYPRAWITAGQWTVSLGADINHKEYNHNLWRWEWSVPFYFEYKVKTGSRHKAKTLDE